MKFVFERYVLFGPALGGTRRQKGGKNAVIIGWIVVSFLRVGVSPLVGQKRTVASLVGEVVDFTRHGPAAGMGHSRGGVP